MTWSAPYGFERETVDGGDAGAVWERFAGFLKAARGGEGPFLLECLTHRRRGHYEGDAQAYREALQDEEWAAHDPIARLEQRARDEGWLEEAQAREIAAQAARCDRGGGGLCPGQSAPGSAAGERAGVRPGMSETTFVKAVNQALARAMREDERVIVLGEDVAEGGPYTATAGLAEEFGTGRVRNTPISEGAVCGVAIGAAQSGLRPVVEIMFIDFITLALDQLANQAAKAHFMSGGQLTVPLVLRTQGGAGERSGAQHSQSLEAWLTHIPGLKVVMPSCAADAAGLLMSAIADPNPVVFIENKALYFRRETLENHPGPVPLGQARVLREGGDVTVIATSRLRHEALQAAEWLADDGIEAEVIDPRTLVPLDLDTLAASVRRTGRAVVAHEAVDRLRLRGRDRRSADRRRLRMPGGADPARRGAVHARPGQPAPGGRLPPGGDGDPRGRADRGRVGQTARGQLCPPR